MCMLACYFQKSKLFKIDVNGVDHDFVFFLPGEQWRKRRRTLSPAFSGHKMKDVSLSSLGYMCVLYQVHVRMYMHTCILIRRLVATSETQRDTYPMCP